MPNLSVKTLSVHLRTNLLATGQYITAFPHSVLYLYAHRFSLKALPLDLPTRPWPVAVLTLKNRTLSPVVERFIECARDVVKSIAHRPQAIKSNPAEDGRGDKKPGLPSRVETIGMRNLVPAWKL
jgi:hypothetical protein